ncbi:hypothetical protein [Leifsonia xyli]|uniref:hypothetical protein n=1 Tax=Leifsonia xyli TaxID=1575 RepID=UPI003D67AA8A
MTAKPSDDHTRYTTGGGTARFVFASTEPDAALVEAVPALATARRAWLAENAEGVELAAAERAAGKALAELRQGPSNTRTASVSPEDFAAREFAYQQAEQATRAQSRRALAALKRYDDLTWEPTHRAQLTAVAVPVAIEQHEKAAEAWKTLAAALDSRDRAHEAAGSPGRPWTARLRSNLGPSGERSNVEQYFAARIDGFDLDALTKEA